ncbi:MAG: carboxypeptidase-like regulatory domain-containing protein [Bacteroidia bacterium]
MRILLLFLLACGSLPLWAQPTQIIKGSVTDDDTRQPLAGATILLRDTPYGAIADERGAFRIEGVPVGSYTVLCRLAGYSPWISDQVVLSSAKELVLHIGLREAAGEGTLDAVEITASEYPHQAVNDLSVVSTRSFSAEETQRYAASVNDPGRMALTFPGVQQGGDDSENDIIIRGNSSFGMLWRLEDIDIPNPNHFARPGTSGGGITVFSAQLLDRSDFSTGAMPAEYGNAISGAFDVHFRKGNMEQREYRFKASLLGLDFATEGPLKQHCASYLVNYRYSTLGLLNRAGFHLVGERVDNDFQDLSFNLALDSRDGKGFLTVFGMGGLSLERYRPVVTAADRDSTRIDQWEDRRRVSNMAAGGITYTRLLDARSHLKLVVAGMGGLISWKYDLLDGENTRFRYNDEVYRDARLATSLSYQRKVNNRLRLKAGAFFNYIDFTFYRESTARPALSDLVGYENEEVSIDGRDRTQTLQAYVQASLRLREQWTLHAGLHFLHLFLNQTQALDPRASLQYRPGPSTTLSLAYGLHSQHLPLGAYFYTETDTTAAGITTSLPNFDLPMIRSHHLVLSYNQLLGKGLRLQVEAYGQRLFQVPVSTDPASTFWMLNNQSGISTFRMIASGMGLNYGVDVALEKFFSGGIFFLLTGSRFESWYELPGDRRFNTRFGTEFVSTYTLGKEFTFRRGSVLQVGARVLYNGGFRYTPPDWTLSAQEGRYIADESQAWATQVKPYFRIDARISYRWNRRRTASILSLDIQNLTDRRNTNRLGYDPATQSLTYGTHPSGFIPVLSYQIDF